VADWPRPMTRIPRPGTFPLNITRYVISFVTLIDRAHARARARARSYDALLVSAQRVCKDRSFALFGESL